jgi:hypothetical protein
VLKEMDSELDRHIEECRNEKNKARKGWRLTCYYKKEAYNTLSELWQ